MDAARCVHGVRLLRRAGHVCVLLRLRSVHDRTRGECRSGGWFLICWVKFHAVLRSQLIPLFVMDVLGKYYGIPGLFTATVFAATLR